MSVYSLNYWPVCSARVRTVSDPYSPFRLGHESASVSSQIHSLTARMWRLVLPKNYWIIGCVIEHKCSGFSVINVNRTDKTTVRIWQIDGNRFVRGRLSNSFRNSSSLSPSVGLNTSTQLYTLFIYIYTHTHTYTHTHIYIPVLPLQRQEQ